MLAPIVLLGPLVAAALAMAPATAPGQRWPIWPTEVDQVAAPLRVGGARPSDDHDRKAALLALEKFATPVIEEEIIAALDDASSQVRREALRICDERNIVACIPPAAKIWSGGLEPTLRVAALRVLAMDPDPTRVAILLAALRDPSEQLRAQAAIFLGTAPLAGEARDQARSALLAKLSDPAAIVRQRAVEALGMLGRGAGTLAITRLLDDPEPTVRSEAATALGRYRDPRAAPALIRALESPNEPVVAHAMLRSLARLPGDDVAAELLTRLDDPPTGLGTHQIATAIGTRTEPEAQLVDGLVRRLREPASRAAALRALLLLGEPTRRSLLRARERGLEPAVDLEVGRLLGALNPPSESRDAAKAEAASVSPSVWAQQLRSSDEGVRIDAAARLAEANPKWLRAVSRHALEQPGPIEAHRGWLMAIAAAEKPPDLGSALAWAGVVGWSNDVALSASDRCLAIAVLGTARTRLSRRLTVEALHALLGDQHSAVRACAVLAVGRRGDPPTLLEMAAVDPAATVRAAAALAMGAREALPPRAKARLAALRRGDTSPEVRAAAGFNAFGGAPALLFVRREGFGWADPQRFIEVEVEGARLWLPSHGGARLRWTLVPAVGGAKLPEGR